MLKADFHMHTSEDTKDNVSYSAKQLIDKAALLGFEVISITNHNLVTYSKTLSDYADSKGILLIPGIELDVEGHKHVLIINPEINKLEKVKTVDDLRRLRRRETVIIAPHPFYPRKTCLGKRLIENISLFDGVEYSRFYNHFINPNRKAVRIAKKHKLPLVGTSDAHSFWQLNTTYSMVDSEKTVQGVIKALKQGKVKVVTRPLPLPKFLMRVLWFFYFELRCAFSSKKMKSL